MPVKWDATKDGFILNVLLLDPSVNIGSAIIENIISSWPADLGDKPTKKAITEHFSKIRKANKKYSDGISTPTATPTKPARATPAKKGAAKTPTSRKRKVETYASESEDDDLAGIRGGVNGENGGSEGESPSKRVKGVVKYEVDDDDDGALISGSDFQGDEA